MPCVHARRPNTGDGEGVGVFITVLFLLQQQLVVLLGGPRDAPTVCAHTQKHTKSIHLCVCVEFFYSRQTASSADDESTSSSSSLSSLPRSLQVFCYFYAFYPIKKIVVYREGQKKQKQAVAACATPFIETTTTEAAAAAATLAASSQLLYILSKRERERDTHTDGQFQFCIGSNWKLKRTTHVFTCRLNVSE